jgi:long-chain acyl-CoA synthetase
MTVEGFWKSAAKRPDRVALIEPDGGAVSAGALLAAGNQLVHGLRSLGVQHGDCIAALLPNGGPILELLVASMQAGLYITPINTNLAAPEIAYILRDCEAKAFERARCRRGRAPTGGALLAG